MFKSILKNVVISFLKGYEIQIIFKDQTFKIGLAELMACSHTLKDFNFGHDLKFKIVEVKK